MGHEQGERFYGAVIERGKVLTAGEDGYTIASFDRDGIETPPMTGFGDASFNVGDYVYFYLFRDGTGKILGIM